MWIVCESCRIKSRWWKVCVCCVELLVGVIAGKVQQLVTDMTPVGLVNVRFVGMLSCMVQTACFVKLVVRMLW